MRFIDVIISPEWVKDFKGLKGVETRLLYKQGYCLLTYFEPTGYCFEPLGKDGIQVSVSEVDKLEHYLGNHWQLVRDVTLQLLSGQILDFVNALQVATVRAERIGCGLSVTGIVDSALAYGITTKAEATSFIRRCYRSGISQERVYLYLTTVLRTNGLNQFLLNEVNRYYEGEVSV